MSKQYLFEKKPKGLTEITINTSSLLPGIYMVETKGENGFVENNKVVFIHEF